ncbi:GumC family protein [Nodosilinea nodulosa]|uniref:GumC family protein n=1 Tax=Nodosilinea nodulosa TaxID=416001 RepID=UPI000307FEC9|nr:tyrosine-protein kinase domain-containing protein [Nodosilinea nodulosa]
MKAQTLQPSLLSSPTPTVEPLQEGGLDFGSLLSMLGRRALLIAGVTVTVTAAAGVRAYLSPPTFSAGFDILVQPLSAEAEVISALSDVPINRKETELPLSDRIRILTSPGVLKPAVDDLRAKGLIGCVPPDQAALTGMSNEALDQQCYNRLKGGVNTQLGKNSRIFRTTYSGGSEQDVQYIATLLSKTFLDYGLASRKQDLQLGLNFLNDEIPEAQKRVDSLQDDLQNLRQTYNIIDPSSQGGNISGQISSFEKQYQDTIVQLEENVGLYEDLQKELTQRPQDTAASPALSDSSRYGALVESLLALDSRIASESTLYLDSSPNMQVLQEQRQNLLKLLAREGEVAQEELMGRIDQLETREAALSKTLASLDVDVNDLAAITRQFTDLERELTLANNSLSDLLVRRENLQVEVAQRELPWELVNPASVTTQVANLQNSLILGFLLGLLVGSGLAFLLESQRDVLYTPKDLKRITPVPILGLIPNNTAVDRGYDEQYLLGLYQPQTIPSAEVVHGSNGNGRRVKNAAVPRDEIFAYREAFRSLVANLQRLDADRPLRSLVISSADNQLADSTTAAYLAWAAAELGNRVLLIDADLRFPHLHDFLDLPNDQGFSNILAGELDLKNVIKRSPSEPNLFVLTTGTTEIDPARLLSSVKMTQFVAKTESYFDLVIYDSPPFAEYADAALLSAETSGLILVSHLGTVKSIQLEQALEKLWIAKIPLIGLIAKEATSKPSLLPV